MPTYIGYSPPCCSKSCFSSSTQGNVYLLSTQLVFTSVCGFIIWISCSFLSKAGLSVLFFATVLGFPLAQQAVVAREIPMALKSTQRSSNQHPNFLPPMIFIYFIVLWPKVDDCIPKPLTTNETPGQYPKYRMHCSPDQLNESCHCRKRPNDEKSQCV